MKVLLGFLVALGLQSVLFVSAGVAAIKTESVDYKDGKSSLEGFLAYDDSWTGVRPAVVIVHQWMGLTDHERESAKRLAEQGYVAFALDIYGKGVRPTTAEEAGKLATRYKTDVKSFRQREKAALDFIAKNKRVDAKRLMIIGYCFGGTGALEAARAGLPVVGAVSFHGGLATPNPQETKNLKAKILVLHGALDPYVQQPEVEGFMKEMNDAKTDYQFISYSGAVHAFTQKGAGNDNSKGAAYNEAAAQRSWRAFVDFLNEVAPVVAK